MAETLIIHHIKGKWWEICIGLQNKAKSTLTPKNDHITFLLIKVETSCLKNVEAYEYQVQRSIEKYFKQL